MKDWLRRKWWMKYDEKLICRIKNNRYNDMKYYEDNDDENDDDGNMIVVGTLSLVVQ